MCWAAIWSKLASPEDRATRTLDKPPLPEIVKEITAEPENRTLGRLSR